MRTHLLFQSTLDMPGATPSFKLPRSQEPSKPTTVRDIRKGASIEVRSGVPCAAQNNSGVPCAAQNNSGVPGAAQNNSGVPCAAQNNSGVVAGFAFDKPSIPSFSSGIGGVPEDVRGNGKNRGGSGYPHGAQIKVNGVAYTILEQVC